MSKEKGESDDSNLKYLYKNIRARAPEKIDPQGNSPRDRMQVAGEFTGYLDKSKGCLS